MQDFAFSSSDSARVDHLTSPTLGEEDLVLGIDLGTSNSAACCVVDGKPVVIDLRDADDRRAGVRSISSVVAFDAQTQSVVGTRALELMAREPRRAVSGGKRFIGRPYDSHVVQKMLPLFSYRVVPATAGLAAVEVDGRVKPFSMIAAYILSAIKSRAEAQLRCSLRRAVITVPAYYNDNQRDAVVQAGRMAGLEVVRILNEPTAAAIAYGLHQRQNSTFLVYDLGGGTFDVSIMRVEGRTLRVLATAGDTFLGGEDFDSAIVEYVRDAICGQKGQRVSQNGAVGAALKVAVEQAKRRLSVRDQTTLTCASVMMQDRTSTKVELPLSREKVEALVAPLIARTLEICDRALAQIGLKPAACDEVFLVGGQTLMPCVRRRVEEHFGKPARTEINPDEAVALGAALLPHVVKNENVVVQDVLSMTLGIVWNGAYKPVIPRNTPVPHRIRLKLTVAREDLARMRIPVLQGDHEQASHNERLGDISFEGLGHGDVDPVPLAVDFSLSADCLLTIRVTNLASGESESVLFATRNPSIGM